MVWRGGLRSGAILMLCTGLLGALYLYIKWPDPVVETRVVSGHVTGGSRLQDEGHASYVISARLDDGRRIMIVQEPLGVLPHGPAVIEERRHRTGRISYRWTGSKSD
jgi:hypothetical protein